MSIFDIFKKKIKEESNMSSDVAPRKKRNLRNQKQTKWRKREAKKKHKSTDIFSRKGKRRVHNLLILDESGSMSSIYQPALTGVNETLQTIRAAHQEHPEQEHFVTLIAFNSSHYKHIYKNTPANKTKDISKEHYRPSAGTPLFDAMGRSITELRGYADKNDVVLVTIITDGYENASYEYDCQSIKALVESMKSRGWVFTYIGANQDVEAVATSISINNHLCFEATQTGARDMFDKEIRCRNKFFSKISRNESMFNIGEDYFDECDEDSM